MPEDGEFVEFVRRIRAGDADAASELVRRYERVIRLEVRCRLTDPRLCRILDSTDICQSVLASFFLRSATGQYDLERPEQLVSLLVAIARNKVAYQARHTHARRRDQRRNVPLSEAALRIVHDEPGPSRLVAGKELLEEFRRRLSMEERRLADLRAEGHDWATIAAALGGTAQGRRKQLARAVQRVEQELGIEGPDDV
jgi:RNA polymerase sigma-70 factor (ECF subfamily)